MDNEKDSLILIYTLIGRSYLAADMGLPALYLIDSNSYPGC